MDYAIPLRTASRRTWLLLLAGIVVLGILGAIAWAQVGGERGIAAIAASSDIEVSGIEVDVSADTGEEAREEAWVEAAKLAWEKIEGPSLPDSQINSLVSAIVIERERLGPKRYIATLGVIFDRQRASRYLGSEGASRARPRCCWYRDRLGRHQSRL